MIIDLFDETNTLEETQLNELEKLIKFTLQSEEVPPHCELSVSFVLDDDIKQLNNDYRQIDVATDVLSFPLDDPFSEDALSVTEEMPIMLGDIVVSIDKVNEQAKEYNHSIRRELSFLIVHGLLHLLGYTHDTAEEEKVMFQKQDDILGAFNIERE